jgi:hypothetical protein
MTASQSRRTAHRPHSLATAEHVQISASHHKSSDNLCGATPAAAHSSAALPSGNLLNRLDLNPIPCPRPHNDRGPITTAALLTFRQRGFLS